MVRSAPLLAAVLLASCASSGKSGPDTMPGDQPGDPALIAPFTDGASFHVNEAYSETASAPWGFTHNGIDFFPATDGVPLRAAAAGTVTEWSLWQNPGSGNWQVNVGIRFNAHYTVEYIFEPFSSSTADGAAQKQAVLVGAGQIVEQGQALGSVKVAGSGAHLHFGLKKDETWLCPDPYFTAEARTVVLDVIRRDHPAWAMCYPPPTCTSSGGTLGTAQCCLSASDFPNTCLVGACGCSPENSATRYLCECPEGKCFDGTACVAR